MFECDIYGLTKLACLSHNPTNLSEILSVKKFGSLKFAWAFIFNSLFTYTKSFTSLVTQQIPQSCSKARE